MPERQYTITPVSQANAARVATVFRAIYGYDFPVKYVYHAGQVMREINEGRLAAALAFDETGTPAGYISMFKCAPNPKLWEGGNVLVVPGHGSGNLASMLMRYYLQPQNVPDRFSDGVFGEAVCHHYFTQLTCSKSGFTDCALALDQVDSSGFREHLGLIPGEWPVCFNLWNIRSRMSHSTFRTAMQRFCGTCLLHCALVVSCHRRPHYRIPERQIEKMIFTSRQVPGGFRSAPSAATGWVFWMICCMRPVNAGLKAFRSCCRHRCHIPARQ
jgi:hypothetical protein